MKKVSVIIPAHNKAALTIKAVESVLSQTYTNVEVIVVDDGSTDDTRVRLTYFSDKIRYVYKDNGGACSARNLGVRLAEGEYIGFLDCDDGYLPRKIEMSVDCLERNPEFGFVHTTAYYMNGNGRILRAHFFSKRRPVGWVTKRLIEGNFIWNSTVVVRKSCFEKVGLFDETIFIPADWDMWLRLAEQYKVGYINIPLTIYRISGNYTFNHLEESEREHSVVLEKAFQRNSIISSRFKNRLISNVHRQHAVCYMLIGDFSKARNSLLIAVNRHRFNLKALFLLLSAKILGKNLNLILDPLRFLASIRRNLLRMLVEDEI